MAATCELIVLGGVASGAVLRRQRLGDREAAVLDAGLALHGMVAVETVDTLDRMLTPLELVDDAGSLVPVALDALARRLDERRSRPVVSTFGRRAFTRKAPTMSAVAITTATKTLLKGMGAEDVPRDTGGTRHGIATSVGGHNLTARGAAPRRAHGRRRTVVNMPTT